MSGEAVGALAIVVLFGGPLAAWIVHRVFAHAEYMEMIRSGMTPPPDARAMRRAAQQGWSSPPPAGQWAPAPPVPPQGQAIPNAYGEYAGYYAQRQLHRGLVTAFVGLAILIGLTMGLGTGPWILGGLIPMFVGLAQIITAVMSGAQLGIPTANAAGQGFGQPSQPGSFGQQQQQQP
ncbi:MAG: hypothetical protein M3R30_01945, partial [Candidatus Eremiobacteraeota bacterium]|nr:hypothetical protein [Candidatus Eremiobacteraeota bacterium]